VPAARAAEAAAEEAATAAVPAAAAVLEHEAGAAAEAGATEAGAAAEAAAEAATAAAVPAASAAKAAAEAAAAEAAATAAVPAASATKAATAAAVPAASATKAATAAAVPAASAAKAAAAAAATAAVPAARAAAEAAGAAAVPQGGAAEGPALTAVATAFFASDAVVRRIEQAEVRLVTAGGRAAQRRRHDALVVPIGGGVAVFSGDGSPFDKVAGLGFAPLDETAFAAFEAAVLARGGAVQVELCTRGDPRVAQALSARGYVLTGFEDVLGLPLVATTAGTGDIAVTRTAPDEIGAWIETVVGGFAAPDVAGVPGHESFARDAIERAMRDLLSAPGVVAYLARRGGEVVGGASLRLDDGIAQLAGAATLPAHRRRGVQTALTRVRLADAARAGIELATVTTLPGSKSQQNSTRQGFSILFTRAVLVKASAPAPGP
jgi:hypothetical protein